MDPQSLPKRPEFRDVIGQRLDLSEYDVIELNKLYNCSEYFPHCFHVWLLLFL